MPCVLKKEVGPMKRKKTCGFIEYNDEENNKKGRVYLRIIIIIYGTVWLFSNLNFHAAILFVTRYNCQSMNKVISRIKIDGTWKSQAVGI